MRMLVARGCVVCNQLRHRKYYDIKKVLFSITCFFQRQIKTKFPPLAAYIVGSLY